MQKVQKKIAFVLCFIIFLCWIPSCNAEYQRPPVDIVREMVHTYCVDPVISKERVSILLKELRNVDDQAADSWTEIVDYWRYLDLEMEMNYERAPSGLTDTDELCIIVLGYQLNPDGSMKDELISRLENTLLCAEAYPNAYVVCTGGGTAGLNPDATEAGEMAKWLIEHGIDKKRLLVEDQSKTTAENAMFSYDLLREKHPQVTSAVIVTSDYHLVWGMILFETQFVLSGREISIVGHTAVHPPFHPGYPVKPYIRDGVISIARRYM